MKINSPIAVSFVLFLLLNFQTDASSVLIDSFNVDEGPYVIAGSSPASGPLGSPAYGADIIGGVRNMGRRQFDQRDPGDLTEVSVQGGTLNIEITDTNPESDYGVDENSIYMNYGYNSPLNLDLSSYLNGFIRLEFSTMPTGLLVDVQLNSGYMDNFSLQRMTANNPVLDIPLRSLSNYYNGNIDEPTDISDIDYILFYFRTDDTGFTSLTLKKISFVTPPYISQMESDGYNFSFNIDRLDIGHRTTIERADCLNSNTWMFVEDFISQSSSTNLQYSVGEDLMFYRVKQVDPEE